MYAKGGAEEKEEEEGEASRETVSNVCGAVLCPRLRGAKKRKQRFSERVQNGSPSVLRPSQDIVTGGERGDDGLYVESWQVASLLSNPISVSVGKVEGVRLTLNSGELLQRVLWSTLPQGERRERLQEMSIRILRGWRDVGNVCNHLG